MEQYSNMSLEELLDARIELSKKRAIAFQASNSPTVHSQFEMMMAEINHQITLRHAKQKIEDENKPDDAVDNILNIG